MTRPLRMTKHHLKETYNATDDQLLQFTRKQIRNGIIYHLQNISNMKMCPDSLDYYLKLNLKSNVYYVLREFWYKKQGCPAKEDLMKMSALCMSAGIDVNAMFDCCGNIFAKEEK